MHTTQATCVNIVIFAQHLHHHAHVTGASEASEASGATPGVAEASDAICVYNDVTSHVILTRGQKNPKVLNQTYVAHRSNSREGRTHGIYHHTKH